MKTTSCLPHCKEHFVYFRFTFENVCKFCGLPSKLVLENMLSHARTMFYLVLNEILIFFIINNFSRASENWISLALRGKSRCKSECRALLITLLPLPPCLTNGSYIAGALLLAIYFVEYTCRGTSGCIARYIEKIEVWRGPPSILIIKQVFQ